MVQSETVLAGNDISLKHPLQAASKMASLWPPFNKSVGLELMLSLLRALKLAMCLPYPRQCNPTLD